MYDHIHRQMASARVADRERDARRAAHERSIRDRPPPWLRRQAAMAAAKAAARLDAESARSAIA